MQTKKAFTLMEIIFVIIIIGIIATIAIPNLGNLTNKAKANTIKSDINTIITSIQNYTALNGNIENITDAVKLDKSIWIVEDNSVIFKENKKDCITITLQDNSIEIDIDENLNTPICSILKESIEDRTIEF